MDRMRRMKEKIQRFMVGRYGMDNLNKLISWIAIIFCFLSFFRIPLMNFLTIVFITLFYYRAFSRNIYKRAAENTKYLMKTNCIRSYIYRKKEYIRMRKTHHIYKCPDCKQRIKIPKGKGKIMVTCPKCKREFKKKS